MDTRYDTRQEPLSINRQTLDRLLKTENTADCIALFVFYYYTAKWQRTSHAKATTSYCAKGLSLSPARVRRAKAELVNLGLIEDFKRVDKETGKVLGWYVIVKFVQIHPYDLPQCGKNHSVENRNTNAVSKNNINAVSRNSKNACGGNPTLDECIRYAQSKAEGNPAPYITQARAAFEFYERNMRECGSRVWKDGNGNSVKNWKLKLLNNWFSKVKEVGNGPKEI